MRKFIKVHDDIMGLKGKHLRVYLLLAKLYDWNNTDMQNLPSYEDIAELSNVKISKVEIILGELEEYGFIFLNWDSETQEYYDSFELTLDY
jgi:DNA-binding MarR family transcriptional regulator